MVTDNPCGRVEPPKPDDGKTVKHFTLEQAEAFLDALDHPFLVQVKGHDRVDDTGKAHHVDSYTEKRSLPLQFKFFFHLVLFCGLRRGELVALEWSDFDFTEKTVSISKSSSPQISDWACQTISQKATQTTL